MRLIILSLTLLLSLSASSQKRIFKGYMAYPDGVVMGYGMLIFPFLNDKVLIDSTGHFQIDISDPKHRVFYLSTGDAKGRIFKVDSTWNLENTYQALVPDTSFYNHYRKTRTCPICLKSKNTIPVVYGLPNTSVQRKAKAGKVKHMWCIVPQYSSKYYCKTDDFYF